MYFCFPRQKCLKRSYTFIVLDQITHSTTQLYKLTLWLKEKELFQ